jgi:hypothetical protein
MNPPAPSNVVHGRTPSRKGLHGRVEETQGMSRQRSAGTGRRFPLTMICTICRLARSSVYAAALAPLLGPPGKRGPKTRVSDGELVEEIRAVLAACPFHGEGYRKVRARLAHRGRAVGGTRVLRRMRTHGLLAPRRLGPPNGNPAHDGTITTDRPDVMWGTDATRFYTERDGWCWFFGAIDHHLDEVVGWHTAKLGERWAALEPIRQGVPPCLRAVRQRGGAGLGDPVRLGPAVHCRRLDQRGEMAGVHDLAVVRRRTRVQRGRRAFHAHAQGAVNPEGNARGAAQSGSSCDQRSRVTAERSTGS